jgi:hypothetical protein
MITKGLQQLITEARGEVESIDSGQAADLLGKETGVCRSRPPALRISVSPIGRI